MTFLVSLSNFEHDGMLLRAFFKLARVGPTIMVEALAFFGSLKLVKVVGFSNLLVEKKRDVRGLMGDFIKIFSSCPRDGLLLLLDSFFH